MKYLQTFKDKVRDLEKAKSDTKKLTKELREEVKEFINLIVNILDEMTPDGKKMTFNINIESKDRTYYKIVNNRDIQNTDRDINLHLNGLSTLLYWKDKTGNDKNDSLWNFNAGGEELYNEIIVFLEGLIKEYDDVYKIVMMKKDSNKYNL